MRDHIAGTPAFGPECFLHMPLKKQDDSGTDRCCVTCDLALPGGSKCVGFVRMKMGLVTMAYDRS
jgi:hypothetical protein